MTPTKVNLVKSSLDAGTPNIITAVVPYVSLDLVSYSSYDSMETPEFANALAFIASHHNRMHPIPTIITEKAIVQMQNKTPKYCQ